MNFNKTSLKGLMVAALAAITLSGCSDVDIPQTPTEPSATDLSYEIDGRSVTLSWAVPEGDITSTELYKNSTLLATLEPDVTTYFIKRQPANNNVVYTVKLKYANGISSLGTSVTVNIEAEPSVPALVIAANSVDELTDDDEIAAAQWFQTTYPQGKILTPDQLANLDPDNYYVLWFNIDREGLAAGYRKLPSNIRSTAVNNAIKDYVALGGNVFLTKHATQLAVPYGFVDALYAPGIFGSGEGGSGDDNWAMNAVIGQAPGAVYDHRNHPIFRGLTTIADYGHETYALMGPGHREDHNCCWDLNTYGFEGDPNTIVNFEEAANCSVLATWAHVVDYCVAGIVEFNPSETGAGRCIAIGLAAYEFKQNSGANPYQANIERLTQNCIDYLGR